MTKNDETPALPKGLIANDGSGDTTPPSPVDIDEKLEADRALDAEATKGQGPAATNEPR